MSTSMYYNRFCLKQAFWRLRCFVCGSTDKNMLLRNTKKKTTQEQHIKIH